MIAHCTHPNTKKGAQVRNVWAYGFVTPSTTSLDRTRNASAPVGMEKMYMNIGKESRDFHGPTATRPNEHAHGEGDGRKAVKEDSQKVEEA